MTTKAMTIEERLSELEKARLSNKDVFTLDDLSKYSGLSKSYLYKLTASARLPHFKPQGKVLYFDKKEIDAWLLRNPVKITDQIECEASTYVTLKPAGGVK